MALQNYTRTVYVEGSDPEITASNLNNAETGIVTATRLAGSIPQTFVSLLARTHPDSVQADDKIQIGLTGYIIMSDGEPVTGWDLLEVDLSVSGAGGLDSVSSRTADTWYEFHAIYDIEGDANALILTEATKLAVDTSFETNDGSYGIGSAAGQEQLAQGFQVGSSLDCPFADVFLQANGTLTDNLTMTIQGDTAGAPDGTPLATADVLLASRVDTAGLYWVRFIFRTPASLTASTQYHLVLDRSGAVDAVNFVSWGTNAAGGYANGALQEFNGATWSAVGTRDANFRIYLETPSNLTIPSPYDSSALLGYARTDGSSNWIRFLQMDRKVKHIRLNAGNIPGSTVAVLVHDTEFLPPTDVLVQFRASQQHTNGQTAAKAAAVPEGVALQLSTITAQDAGGVFQLLQNANNAEAVQDVGLVFTSGQGYYIAGGDAVDTVTLFVDWWEWLK